MEISTIRVSGEDFLRRYPKLVKDVLVARSKILCASSQGLKMKVGPLVIVYSFDHFTFERLPDQKLS